MCIWLYLTSVEIDFYSLPGAGCEDISLLSVCYQIKLYIFPSFTVINASFHAQSSRSYEKFCRKLNSHHLLFQCLTQMTVSWGRSQLDRQAQKKDRSERYATFTPSQSWLIWFDVIHWKHCHHLALFVYFYNNQNIYWCGI